MVVRADFSAAVTERTQAALTLIQLLAYVQWKLASGGFHTSGLLSPLEALTLSVTAQSCGLSISFANSPRLAVVQDDAPDFWFRKSKLEVQILHIPRSSDIRVEINTHNPGVL